MTTTPLCRFRVLYLGSEVPTRSKDGLQGIQEPLELLYPEIGAPELAGVDAFLSVWSNGVLVEPVVINNNNNTNSGASSKRFYHIDSLHYCAAVRYSEYGGQEPSSRDIGLLRFLPLDTLQARDSASHHPPLFTLIMRRASGIKLLECKVFVCKSDEAANELVRACFRAYSDTTFAHVLEHSHAPHILQQQQQQQIHPMAVNNNNSVGPIVGTHGYAGSALMAPTSRSLIVSRMSHNSSSVEHLNNGGGGGSNGVYSDSGSRMTESHNDKTKKKKKRSPFWPFVKPAGERRRSRSLNTPRPLLPSAAAQQQQQQVQPVLVAPPEYGSLVYYLPTNGQPSHYAQKANSLLRMSSTDSSMQSSRNLIVNPPQPLQILYAAPPSSQQQQQHPHWTPATPVYLGSSSSNGGNGYIPTTSSSFISNDYAAYYEQPMSVPYHHYSVHQQQQPWNTNVGNYDDLVYYDPYYHQQNPAGTAIPGVVNSNYVPPNTDHQSLQPAAVNLRKTKSLAVRPQEEASAREFVVDVHNSSNDSARRHITSSPHHHRRHRVRSGDIVSSSSTFAELGTNAAAAAKPPIMLKTTSRHHHHHHPDSSTLPGSSSSKSTSVSSTTSSLSSSAPPPQHKPPQYLLSGDRSHAHTKSMVIPEDQANEIEELENDQFSTRHPMQPQSHHHHHHHHHQVQTRGEKPIRTVERNEILREQQHTYETSRDLLRSSADQSSTSSAFSSASGNGLHRDHHHQDEQNSASSLEGSGRQLSPPPLPPPSPMSPSLLFSNNNNHGSSLGRRSQPGSLANNNDIKNVKFDDNSAAAYAENKEHELARLVDELRIGEAPNKPSLTGRDHHHHMHWQQVTTKTKVKQINKRAGSASISPVDSGQHEPTTLHDDLHTTAPSVPYKSGGGGDRPYIPEVDYDI